MLFLVATPIGNLADITFRAIETLRLVDYILCEDTRRSRILLNQYEIKKPLKSFHKFNEKKIEDQVIKDLAERKKIALISDAGTPGISDPGQRLIQRCRGENLPFTAIPGPSAPILALTLSGFDANRFQFLGFLPKKASLRKKLLIEAIYFPGTTIFFESPHRIKKTLIELANYAPDQQVALAREMTKIHEECLHGTPKELSSLPIKGEYVLLIEGNKQKQYSISPKEHVQHLQKEFDLSKQEAIKIAANLRFISKKTIYF